MKKAAIYIRVSTIEQADHGFSIDEQRERLIAYCMAMGWQVCGIYVDGGYTGSNTDRPGLQKLIAEIKLIDVVVIYKLDRLSRSQKDTLTLIEDTFIKNNVDIVSLQENLDTSTPFGRAAIGILSAFGQLERETFKERSILGRTGRARKGKWVGSGRPPIGYDYSPEKQELIINPYEAEQVKEVFDLYLKGTGLTKIARLMHQKGYKHKYGDWLFWGGVITMLKNSVYIGKVTFDDKEFDGHHEPIISVDVFNKAHDLLSKRSTGQIYKRNSPLSHLMYCANCGARMFFLRKNGREPKYYCYSRYGHPIGCVKDRSCKMRIWPAALIEETVLSHIDELAKSKKEISKIILSGNKPKRTNTNELEKRIVELDKQIGKLIELYQYDSVPVDQLNERIRLLHDEKNSVSAMIRSVTEVKNKEKQTIQSIHDAAREITLHWNEHELMMKMELINVLISKIVIDHETIDIHWTFADMTHE